MAAVCLSDAERPFLTCQSYLTQPPVVSIAVAASRWTRALETIQPSYLQPPGSDQKVCAD